MGLGFQVAPVRTSGSGSPGANQFFAQRGDEAFGVEDGFLFEHEIDGAGQLDGEHHVRLELAVEPRFEALSQRGTQASHDLLGLKLRDALVRTRDNLINAVRKSKIIRLHSA